jgi:predicted TIM-barrel fold metal-dependent hydrolase
MPRDFGPLQRRTFLKRTVGALAGLSAAVSGCRSATERPTGKARVIDTHMHVWSDDLERFPLANGIRGGGAPGTMEALLEEMESNGVDHCVLVQSIHHQWDNRYVAHCLKAHPKEFRVQGLIDPTQPDVADKLEYWVKEHGFSGVRLRPIYHRGKEGWLDGRSTDALWERAAKLDAIFNFYIGTEQLPRLEHRLKRFPSVRVAIDHLSQIDLKSPDAKTEMEKLLALARYPQVFVKVSELASVSKSGTYPFDDAYPWVQQVYEAFGAERLLWGTGYPGPAARAEAKRPTVAEELRIIREKLTFLSAADRDKILGLNAQKLWRFA